MGRKKVKPVFEFPQEILTKINEMSSGGYLLFVYDEYGNPQVYCQFDTMPHYHAMLMHGENWVTSNKSVHAESMDKIIRKKLT